MVRKKERLFNFFISSLIILSLTLVSIAKEPAQDFYVSPSGNDRHAGSIDSPFKSIQKAADLAQPGTTIYIREGTYYEKIVVRNSGAPKAWIKFLPYQKEHVIIDGTFPPQNEDTEGDCIFYLTKVKYIEIAGLELLNKRCGQYRHRKKKNREGSAIKVIGSAEHIIIRDNYIHDILGKNAMAITIYGSDKKKETGIHHLKIINNRIENCEPSPSETITLNGHITHFEITKNHVKDTNNIGIDIIGGESWLSHKRPKFGIISQNKIENCFSNYEDGFAAGIYVDGASHIKIFQNHVSNCDLGIEIGAENKKVIANHIQVYQNLIHHNYKAGLVFGGFSKKNAGKVQQCIFHNNTLYFNNRPGEQGPYAMSKGAKYGEIWVQYSDHNIVHQNLIIANPNVSLYIASWKDKTEYKNIYQNNCYYHLENLKKISFRKNGQLLDIHSADFDSNPVYTDTLSTEQQPSPYTSLNRYGADLDSVLDLFKTEN